MTDLQKFADKTSFANKPSTDFGQPQSATPSSAKPVQHSHAPEAKTHLANAGQGTGEGSAPPSEHETNIDTPDPDKSVDNARLDPTRYGDWEKNGRCIDF